MRTSNEGSIYCWTVRFGAGKWKAFKSRRRARAFRKEVNGALFKMVGSH